MAQFEVRLFPASLGDKPSEEAVEEARNFLYDEDQLAEDIDGYFHPSPTLVEGGGRAETTCPSCGALARIELDFGYYNDNVIDTYGWPDRPPTGDGGDDDGALAVLRMDEQETQDLFARIADAGDPSDVEIGMPCCGSVVPFVRLDLGDAYGLTLFELKLGGEMDYPSFNGGHVAALEKILSCRLKGYGYVIG